MHQWQVAGVNHVDTYGVTKLGASTGVVASANAASALGSKGAWVVLCSGTSRTYESLVLTIAGKAAANYLVDLGIGSSTAIYTIQENLPMPSLKAGENYAQPYLLPIHVPLSSQLLVRCCATVSAAAIETTLHGMMQGLQGTPGFAKGVAWGVNSANSRGTTLDAGATANTKSALTVIQTTVLDNWKAMAICFGNAADIARTNLTFLVDVFVNSQPAILDVLVKGGTDADVPVPFWYPPFACVIKSGDIISGRVQSASTTAGDRALDILLLGYR